MQRWWAEQLVRILRRSAGLTFEVEGLNLVAPGPIVMCAQHAILIDALTPMWLLGQVGMHPRYVLKDADLVFVTHTGLETLQQVTDAPRQMPLRRPVRIQIARVPRCDILAGAAFTEWLDTQWARLNHELASSRHVLLEAARSSADNGARIGDRDPLLRGR